MKLLVFAHTPPPHHGQSYMVQLMLEGFGGDRRKGPPSATPRTGFGIDCYHVNARLSSGMEDIGGFRLGKIVTLLGYCFAAIWCRFRYGVENLYYVPAPGKRAALYRDWIVMGLCRPFFKRTVLHWHAAGLASWLDVSVHPLIRWITFRLLGKPHLSIILSEYNRGDAQTLRSRRIAIVSNGICDPCPSFQTDLLPRRLARFAARRKLSVGEALDARDLEHTGGDPHLLKVLYLAHCTREKGLFDAIDAIEALNRKLSGAGAPLRARLTIAGEFINAAERKEFEARLGQAELQSSGPPPATPGGVAATGLAVQYLGFISGNEKVRVLSDSDCFCFPTYYLAENLPVVLVEAMAFGLPIVATRWRSLPELFPAGYRGLVNIRSPDQLAAAVHSLVTEHSGVDFRERFLREFTLQRHLSGLAAALSSLETSGQKGAGA